MAQNSVTMRSLFVGNIPKDLENPEEFLATLFGKVGLVLSVKLCRDVSTQKSLGHAYVNFQNVADAERAQQQLNYHELANYPGRELRVAFSERDPNIRTRGKSLFVKNLDTAMSNKALMELFAEFGAIIDCSQATDNQGRKLGFGTVQFAEDAAADKALAALNGKTVNGKELSIAVKEREEDKTYTKIFVRGIKSDATDEEIRAAIAEFAKPPKAIGSLVVNVNPTNGTRSAIVDLADHESAVKAVETLNEKKHETLSPGDAVLAVSAYRKPAERRAFVPSILQNEGRNLYVKHLPDDTDEKQLRDLFGIDGEIESVSLAMDGGVFRGFAFVCFKTKEGAQRAIARLNGHMYFKRPLYVSEAQHQDQRQSMLADRQRQFATNGPMPMGGRMGGPNMMMPGYGMPGPYGMPGGMPPNPMMMMGGRGGMMGMPRGPMMMGAPFGFNNGPRGPFNGPRGPFNNNGPRQMNNNNNRGPRQNNNQISMAQLQGKSVDEQKNLLGERLYNNINRIDGERAAKITGMLLELPTEEIIAAINDFNVLTNKVTEAQNILAQHSS